MTTPILSKRTYKFNFIKDRFWMWAVTLPFGLICWAIPFVMFFGLLNTRNSPGWFPFFGFIMLGIPGYLIGWIFVYSLMEGIYTKVTFAENWISIKLPWLIFPLLSIEKRIEIGEIHRVNLFAPYGSRMAVFLYYYSNNKEKHFYIPRFKDNPAYMEEILEVKKRVEVDYSPENLLDNPDTSTMQTKTAMLQKKIPRFNMRPSFFERVIRLFYFLILIANFSIGCWIASSIPPGGIQSVELGFGIAMAFSILGLLGLFPLVGQIIFWFWGRWAIKAISGFFFHLSTDLVFWDTPEAVHKLLAQFNIPPIHASYSDFLFWSTFVFSIIISLDNTIGWFKRKAINREMKRNLTT
jgi:hypothetical protein